MTTDIIITAAIKDEFDNYYLSLNDRFVYDTMYENNLKFRNLVTSLLDTSNAPGRYNLGGKLRWHVNLTPGKLKDIVRQAKTKGMIMGDEDITMVLVTPKEAYTDDELFVFGGCMARHKFRIEELEPWMVTSFVKIPHLNFDIHQVTISNPANMEDPYIYGELKKFTAERQGKIKPWYKR